MKKSFVLFLLILGSIVILSPVWWMISTSLKTPGEIAQYPPSFMPESFQWSNYLKAWQTAPFTRWAINTIFITVCVVIGNVVVNSFVAYGFAKIRFRGKNFLFMLVLSTMLIPGFVMMIPQYMLFQSRTGSIRIYH